MDESYTPLLTIIVRNPLTRLRAAHSFNITPQSFAFVHCPFRYAHTLLYSPVMHSSRSSPPQGLFNNEFCNDVPTQVQALSSSVDTWMVTTSNSFGTPCPTSIDDDNTVDDNTADDNANDDNAHDDAQIHHDDDKNDDDDNSWWIWLVVAALVSVIIIGGPLGLGS